ncbi:MAG: hypothetical protein MI861_10715 [Pirellulales bacterium]|nr:hypothetical protein [Pirellulales bacterium]
MTTNSSLLLRRRHFLFAAAAAPISVTKAWGGGTGKPIMLTPQRDHNLFRVRMELEAKGNINVPENALVSRQSRLKLPLTSKASFDYEERFRLPQGADSGSPVTLAERYYHQAQSTNRINKTDYQSQLRPSVRDTIVRREQLPEVIYSVEDYFRQEELELLRLPASSVALEQLLPVDPVQPGSRYVPEQAVLVSVLNLTSVEASSVEAEVVSTGEADAKIHFRGKIEGSVEGVPTVLRTVGKLTFDRVMGMCTWLAMAVHETREIGKAEPGFDLSANIQMLRKPIDAPVALPAQPRRIAITAPIPTDRLFVELRSRELGFETLMDRRWRVMQDVPGAAMMRMIDQDRSIAQCDFRPLVSLEAGSQWTLEALQQDVQRMLGEQLRDLLEAEQSLSDGGLRVLRVVAQGVVQGVPIQWIVMHFSDDSSRRLLATFTMEGDNIAEFAGSDVQLAATMRLVPPQPRPAPASTSALGSGSSVQPGSTLQPSEPVARTAKINALPEVQVQSASDLR